MVIDMALNNFYRLNSSELLLVLFEKIITFKACKVEYPNITTKPFRFLQNFLDLP